MAYQDDSGEWREDVLEEEESGEHSGLIFRAILLSIFVSSPALYEFYTNSTKSPVIFSDWDEAFYYNVAFDLAKAGVRGWYDGTSFSILSLFTPISHNITTFLVGLHQYFLGIKSTSLALYIDVVLFPIVYFILTKAFRHVSSSYVAAELATVVMLCFPWITDLPALFHIPIDLPPDIVRSSHFSFPSLPIERGVNTQLSYFWLAISLLFLFRGMNDEDQPSNSFFVAGLATGVSIYVYFFCWPSLTAVASILLFSFGMRLGVAYNRVLLAVSSALTFLCGAFIPALPALFFLIRAHFLGSEGSVDVQAASAAIPDRFWYFSPEQAALLVFILILTRFSRFYKSIGGMLAVASLIAEFVLMNSQGALNKFNAPYHFPLFYLNPLASAGITLLIFEVVRARALQYFALFVFCLVVGLGRLSQVNSYKDAAADNHELVELIEAVELYVPYDGIILYNMTDEPLSETFKPYHILTLPHSIRALTQRKIHADFVTGSGISLLKHELLAGWIFTGKLGPVMPCPDKLPALPGDVLQGMMTREYWSRFYTCQKIDETLKSNDLCELLNEIPFDAVIWDHSVLKGESPHSRDILRPAWRSASGKLELLLFNRDFARQTLCKQPASPPDMPKVVVTPAFAQ